MGNRVGSLDVFSLWPSDISDGWDDLSPDSHTVADLVRDDLVRVRPKDRHVGEESPVTDGVRVL